MVIKMEKQELLKKFAKQEEKLLISKVWDKLKFANMKNQIQTTYFLDSYEQNTVTKMLNLCKEKQYILDGGYEEAQRKILFLYPDKLQELFEGKREQNKVVIDTIKVISIMLPEELQGSFHHAQYLGGLMKLGIKREIIGDIIVNEKGADILVLNDMVDYLQTQLKELTRFQKSEITVKELTNLNILPVQKEEMIILIPQMRLDVVVSEILHLSRSKANELISSERVFVNYELKTKNATMLKQQDVLTIRGKGKYEIGEIVSQTAKGKLRLQVQKYIS